MRKTTLNAFLDRMGGERPAAPRAAAVAVSVGIATAAIVYRVLRHEAESE